MSVYSSERSDPPRRSPLDPALEALIDRRNQANGIEFLARLPDCCAPLAFFDPQYRGVLDHLSIGNEGARQQGRALLSQMDEGTICAFLWQLARVLAPRGHLMLWVDKFHLVEGVEHWIPTDPGHQLRIVDMITWDKGRIGMGYRSRRRSEYLLVIQKLPVRAKGCWTDHTIPDVWLEKIDRGGHAHAKPLKLQSALIAATTAPDDIVIDPAAGGYSVMKAAHAVGRRFLGCDLLPEGTIE